MFSLCIVCDCVAFTVDMSSLVFEVLTGVSQTPVGRAQLDHIATLSPTHPISGYFSLL